MGGGARRCVMVDRCAPAPGVPPAGRLPRSPARPAQCLLVSSRAGDAGEPAPRPSRPRLVAERAAALAAKLTDPELVGQVLMPSVNLGAAAADSAKLVADFHLGGLVLMGDVQNTAAGGTAAQVRSLTDALQAAAPTVGGQKPDLLLGTDQEYGWVTRIRSGLVQLPSAMTFGAAGRPDLTEAAWPGAGQELAAVGINVDFAPDADVIGPPGNYVIGSRSFGARPGRGRPTGRGGGARACSRPAWPRRSSTSRATATPPSTATTALPVLTQSRDALTAKDLPPFQAGIQAGVGA